eukprot:Skav233818  [mRNA]  locus=scaffold5904:58285:60156:+ [translate_table: standard]
MQLRPYQERIVADALESGNTIVVLPTGAGKTLIASELIARLGSPCLFLVPMCLLVEQQAQAVREWTGLNVAKFMGGMTLPEHFDVLVSTPKAFQVAQGKGACHLSWSSFRLVIFDEVHHVLKDHPYRKLAVQLAQVQEHVPQVLGLTASLTYAVGDQKVQSDIARICRELRIRKMATADGHELAASGYHARASEAVVKPLDLPGAVPSGVLPISERKPHLMGQFFIRRLRSSSCTPFTQRLFEVVQQMEAAVTLSDPSFESPLANGAPSTWGDYAHKKIHQNQMCESLEHWYEALRILATSWEEAEDTASAFLQMVGESTFKNELWEMTSIKRVFERSWHEVPNSYPRFEHLKEVLLHEYDSLTEAHGRFRGILFVQQRIMTHVLDHVIQTDVDLAARFRPTCIYATSSPASPSFSVSAAESKIRLAAFASGRINLLIATVVAEEGMDVPEANCVIRFDPMINSVSFVQGRGRARQAQSSFVVLSEREDRPTSTLAAIESQQLQIVRDFQPLDAVQDVAKEQEAQKSRERNARDVLIKATNSSPAEALAALNLYCRKTKVELQETMLQADNSKQFTCVLRYCSILRTVEATGSLEAPKVADAKKGAKRIAAVTLLTDLRQATS